MQLAVNLELCGVALRRYNLLVSTLDGQVRQRSSVSSFLLTIQLMVVACCLSSCATRFGPGYVVEKQEIQVSFVSQPEPHLHVVAEYHLKNTGIQVLNFLNVRLPGRRFNPAELTVLWDGAPIGLTPSADNPRYTTLSFSRPWTIGDAHTMRFVYDIRSDPEQQGSIGFSADAFSLPAEAWTPTLPQARGVFGFGGVPPAKWDLVVRVPQDFLVHASGSNGRRSKKNAETELRFEQTARDLNPFVIAGRYRERQQSLPGNQLIRVWNRADLNSRDLQQLGDSLSKTLATYDSLFGSRGKSSSPLWIVECPSNAGCLSQRSTGYTSLLYGFGTNDSAEMVSRDAVIVDFNSAQHRRETLAGPALAAGWLGYGQNPGFYDQQPPMSALPAFAAAIAREAFSGTQARSEIIQRALAQIPDHASRQSNDNPTVTRAKSLLLFFALRDHVGPDHFQKAIQHMLSSRQTRGFEITDLISALEEESHQAVGPFVREWIKRPGVPNNFRSMHSQSTARQDALIQEETQ